MAECGNLEPVTGEFPSYRQKRGSKRRHICITQHRGSTLFGSWAKQGEHTIHDDVIKWKYFRVTGPLYGEFTAHRWIPYTKVSFFWSTPWINRWVNNREAGDLTRHRVHHDVTLMRCCVTSMLRPKLAGIDHGIQRKPLVNDPGLHHGTCHARAVMHVGIANPRWRGKRSRHSWRMRNPTFYVSGKRLMGDGSTRHRW